MPVPPRSVLMVCYYFPPIMSTGVTRSRSFAELLPRFGWTPVVLTVANCRDPWVGVGTESVDWVRVHRTHEWNLAGLVDLGHSVMLRVARIFGVELRTNWLRDILCIPDTQIAWSSTWAGVRLASGADVVYVSCSPFSSALSGAAVKLLSGKPLVVDFRDAWTLNPHLRPSRWHLWVAGLMERVVVRFADRLILNTEGAAALYRRKYPRHAGRILAIPNGYDELPAPPRALDPSAPFRIVHAGSFYGSRSPELLLQALCELPDCNIEFVQVGEAHPDLARYGDRLKITVTGALPRAEALSMMSTASLLYLKQGWEPGMTDYIAVAAKTYEYLATGIPILAEVPPGDNADIVREYAGRSWVVTARDTNALKEAVLAAYASRGEAPKGVKPEFVARFARSHLTQQLAAVFDAVSGPRPGE